MTTELCNCQQSQDLKEQLEAHQDLNFKIILDKANLETVIKTQADQLEMSVDVILSLRNQLGEK
jgi:hypothetical protein